MTKEKEDELKKQLMEEDPDFKRLMEEHIEFENKLEEYNKKAYLTPDEETDRKKIQKLKLMGKDKMEVILSNYRKGK